MEYEKSDQGGKMITWHVDEDTSVPKKVVLALYNSIQPPIIHIIIHIIII